MKAFSIRTSNKNRGLGFWNFHVLTTVQCFDDRLHTPSPSNAIYIFIAPSHCSSGVSICLMTCCTMYNNHGLHCTLLNMSCNCMTKCRSFTVSCCSWTVTELDFFKSNQFIDFARSGRAQQNTKSSHILTTRLEGCNARWPYGRILCPAVFQDSQLSSSSSVDIVIYFNNSNKYSFCIPPLHKLRLHMHYAI